LIKSIEIKVESDPSFGSGKGCQASVLHENVSLLGDDLLEVGNRLMLLFAKGFSGGKDGLDLLGRIDCGSCGAA
jgi:hypothetical protein